jgi:TROVE domain
MAKFNQPNVRAAVSGPLQTESAPSGRTALGHPGYKGTELTELFKLGVANFVGEDTYHENAFTRDSRFRELVRTAAVEDPVWLTGFLHWLRTEGNMRSAPVLAAAEAVQARWEAGNAPFGRKMVETVLQRADEPAEIWAYWLSAFGRKSPHAFQRGVADAIHRLYTERSLLRYDSAEGALRFGDVIELSRPRYNHDEYGTWRDALYRFAIMRRHDRDFVTDRDGDSVDRSMFAALPMISRARDIFAMPVSHRRHFLLSQGGAQRIEDAGIKWESVAGWLQGPMDADAWTACIPSMGFMALIRNVRNFDQAGVSDDVLEPVFEMLADPDAVAGSRQFPFRFLAAYRAADSVRWNYPLEKALNLSLSSVPALRGRTLILVDRSPSMWDQKMSKRSTMDWADGAAIFGAALATRAQEADLVEFWGQDTGRGRNAVVKFRKSESVLKIVDKFARGEYGTDIPTAVENHFRRGLHDQVVIITDEQTRAGWLPSNCYSLGGRKQAEIDSLIPADVPVFMWNLGGYKHGALPTGPARHLFAGLADGAFRQLALLHAGRDATWPWMQIDPAVAEQFETRPKAGARTAEAPRSTVPEEYMTDGPWRG